jgi:hypothetical protein
MGVPRRINHSEVVKYLLANPTCTSADAAVVFCCYPETVRAIAKKEGIMKGWFKKE